MIGNFHSQGFEGTKKHIILAGTISNVATEISKDLNSIRRALSDHNLTHIILVESDSTDMTINVVQALASLDIRIEIVSLGELRKPIPDRVERIRYCRQIYVDRIREIQRNQPLDYVVIADFDGMNSRISKADINFSFSSDGWDVALSNQTFGYYDIFALRHPEWMPGNCFEEFYMARQELLSVKQFQGNFLGKFFSYYLSDRLKMKYVYSRMRRIPRSAQSIEVESGFGGFGIYRSRIFEECDYAIKLDKHLGECEHISLSRQLSEKGYTIFIHPWLINSNFNTYNINKITLIRHLRALRRFLKSLSS